MLKDKIQKIEFNYPNAPIEIFCTQQYKGYYIRGQITELSDNIYDKKLDEDYGYAFYRFVILALVNNRGVVTIDEVSHQFGIICETTEKEFIDAQNAYDLHFVKEELKFRGRKFHETLNAYKKMRNPTLTINLEEVNIIENKYLIDSINAKKDVILLSLNVYLDRIESPKDGKLIAKYPKRIHALPAYHFSKNSEYEKQGIYSFLSDLPDILYYNFDYNYLDRKEYHRILTEIGNLSYTWIKRKKVSNHNLKSLNKFNQSMGNRTYPLTDFCYKFLDDLINDIVSTGKVGICEECSNLFLKTRINKKFCSQKCAKKARNRRAYQACKQRLSKSKNTP